MLELIPRKYRTLIFTILGLVLVLFMLYVFDLHRLDEWSAGNQPTESPPAGIAH
ncbi:MAG TPA: hypothetical protein VMW38_29000 [Terriglobia bacterium]|nr:hypothetical protein [Terriglobia bacterium]